MDPQGANRQSNQAGKISYGMIKFYVESFGADGVDVMVKSAD